MVPPKRWARCPRRNSLTRPEQDHRCVHQPTNRCVRAGRWAADVKKGNVAALQAKLDVINKEHHDTYIDGFGQCSSLSSKHVISTPGTGSDKSPDVIHGSISTVDYKTS